MRIAIFTDTEGSALGVVKGTDIAVVARGDAQAALSRLVSGGADAMSALHETVPTAPRVRLDGVRLGAPVPRPGAPILCVGKNYHAHAREFFGSGFDSTGQDAIPPAPVFFAKTASCIVGPGAGVKASLDPTCTVDYEGELAVVIGSVAHQVPKARALDVIFGYTICNDVTSRELQKRHSQWLIGKSLDTFGPLGPWIVTADEMGDVTQQELVTRINGEERQRALISDLIFDIPTLIETLTRTMTLQPGDIIATGTPAGVGIGFKPPRYLQPGDTMDVSISGIGSLRNKVI
jgi:2-keto-4-pentenoate hydratase/2-oxohepta-3-ene-1,7-dioic acid hydratase in catechol pathway